MRFLKFFFLLLTYAFKMFNTKLFNQHPTTFSLIVCLDLHLETIMIVVCVEIMVKLWKNFIPNNIGVENLIIVDNPLSHDIICLYNDKYDDITTPRLSTISLRM